MHRFSPFPAAAGLTACLLLGSCRSAPPPRPLPALPVQVLVGGFAGAALAGPQPDATPPPLPARVYRLHYELRALVAMPRGAVPLVQRAQLLARPDSQTPLRASSAAAAPVAMLTATAARQLGEQLATAPASAAVSLAAGNTVAAAGYTTTLRVVDAEAPLHSNSILIAIDADLALHLLFAADRDRQLELLQLPAATAADAPFVFAWPRPLPGGSDGAIALLLQFEPSDAAANADALAQLQQQAGAVQQAAAARIEPPTQQYLQQQRRLQAVQALQQPDVRRRALLQLAQEAGAGLVADLTLSADDDLLAATVAAVGADADLAALPTAQLALALERAGYRALLPHLDQDDADPVLLAVLYAHAGAVGGDRNALQSMVERAADPAQLRQLLVQENLAFLYEDDPARMVAAFDWLQTQGLAPAGFDPLADRSARRAALRAHEQAATAEQGR